MAKESEVREWIDWIKRDVENFDSENIYFMLRLLESLGSTFMGEKPAKLLNICSLQKNKSFNWQIYKNYILKYGKINLREIDIGNTKRAFFYHIDALDNTLGKTPNLRFLKSLGYPKKYSLAGYIEHITYKMGKGKFPHEIGIFLGYPLKDVMGFMGYRCEKPSMTKGWKYYGDVEESFKKYQNFWRARVEFRKILYSSFNQPKSFLKNFTASICPYR